MARISFRAVKPDWRAKREHDFEVERTGVQKKKQQGMFPKSVECDQVAAAAGLDWWVVVDN